MSPNLIGGLTKLLAESRAIAESVKDIKDAAQSRIPQSQQELIVELNKLRDQIRENIGKDKAAEDRYLELLGEVSRLDQIYLSHPSSSNSSLTKNAKESNRDLTGAIWFAQILCKVYERGVLIKSAEQDLISYSEILESYDLNEAQQISTKLRAILNERGNFDQAGDRRTEF